MSSRKYPCGTDKRKRKEQKIHVTQSLSGSLKYLIRKPVEGASIEGQNLVSEEQWMWLVVNQ